MLKKGKVPIVFINLEVVVRQSSSVLMGTYFILILSFAFYAEGGCIQKKTEQAST